MEKSPDERVVWDTCDNENCDEQTPWDMLAVIADDLVFCSPECARESSLTARRAEVWLHDPQYTVDRETVALDPNTVQMQPPVKGQAAIDAIEEIVDARWRV